MCQEAEWGGGAFFLGGEVLLPTKPHGCSAAPTWLVWPWPPRSWGLSPSHRVPEVGGHWHCVGAAASSPAPFPGCPLPGDYKPPPCASLDKLFPSPPTSHKRALIHRAVCPRRAHRS